MTKHEKAAEIIKRLTAVYPQPRTALNHSNPLELLIATMLSAQTTDKLVNTLTPALFSKYKTASDFVVAPLEEIDEMIKKVNFHRNKTKNIKEATKIIAEKYHGNVPDAMEELDALPGVARKTANVVLGNAFNKAEGIAVDTHVLRLARKWGLTKNTDPVKVEQDLMKIVPKDKWIDFSHLLINFGREYCPARPHVCKDCPLGEMCPDK
jgi:endonuclease III